MSWAALVLVSLGGVLGAPARFALDAAVTARTARDAGRADEHPAGDREGRREDPAAPRGTLVVNLLGAALLGLLAGSAAPGPAPLWLVAAGTGFCGSFTTFSTATLEAVRLGLAGRWAAAGAAAALHLVGSLVALGLGLALATALRG